MEEKPKRTSEDIPLHAPCIICGSIDYEWGKLADGGFTQSALLGMGRPDARRCRACGNVQLFHQPPEWFTDSGG